HLVPHTETFYGEVSLRPPCEIKNENSGPRFGAFRGKLTRLCRARRVARSRRASARLRMLARRMRWRTPEVRCPSFLCSYPFRLQRSVRKCPDSSSRAGREVRLITCALSETLDLTAHDPQPVSVELSPDETVKRSL